MDNETENTKQGLYDAEAQQTFSFEITEDGAKYDTAHVFNALSDARYLEYFKSLKTDSSDEEKSNASEVTVALWRDLIKEVSNIETADGADFRDELDADGEIIPAMENFLAVAVIEPEKTTGGVRRVARKSEQTIETEAYFNGTPVRQTHTLKAKTDEWSKRFNAIVRRQWKTETTRGLSRKAKVEFHPQIEAFGKLYDEMFVSQTGFANQIPLRFKTAVLNYVFAAKLDEKK